MRRLVSTMAAGCCCAALVACATGVEKIPEQPRPTTVNVALPQPQRAWDVDFAAATTLERLVVGQHTLLVPVGLQLPSDATVTAATEATVVMADGDPARLVRIVGRSARQAGYEEFAAEGDVTVWTGHGMAVRLEARDGAQVLAWGPESMKDSFAEFH